MKKIVIHSTTNSVGTDSWEFFEVPDDCSDSSLDNLANECALSNAEMYGIYPPSDNEDDYDDDDSSDENIEGTWEIYNSDKHDGYTMTGTPVFQET